MPEQLLSLIDRPAGIKDIRGESMPHLMRRRRPAQPSPPGCSGDQVVYWGEAYAAAPMIPTPAAIANAFAHATGRRATAMPLTRRRVLEALS